MKAYRNFEKTKKAIRNAFIKKTTETQNIDAVTVKDLIEMADIAKSTYYYHYKDIESLVNEICVEIIKSLEIFLDKVKEYDGGIEKNNINTTELTKILKENDTFFKALFNSSKTRYFVELLNELLNKRFQEARTLTQKIIDTTSIHERKIVINMLVNSITYSFVDYYNGKLDVTIEDLVSLISNRIIPIVLV